MIFDLSVLKCCKLSFQSPRQISDFLSIDTNKSSPIEYLVIHNESTLEELNLVLAYVPHLRRLSWHKLNTTNNYKQQKLQLKHLTNVSLEFENIPFHDFQSMIMNLFHYLEILQLTITSSNREYLNPNRWEQLISNYIPNLRIFDFQHRNKLRPISDISLTCMQLNTLFTSSFWSKHQWFFTHQCIWQGSYYEALLYSTNPYRYKKFFCLLMLYNKLIIFRF